MCGIPRFITILSKEYCKIASSSRLQSMHCLECTSMLFVWKYSSKWNANDTIHLNCVYLTLTLLCSCVRSFRVQSRDRRAWRGLRLWNCPWWHQSRPFKPCCPLGATVHVMHGANSVGSFSACSFCCICQESGFYPLSLTCEVYASTCPTLYIVW